MQVCMRTIGADSIVVDRESGAKRSCQGRIQGFKKRGVGGWGHTRAGGNGTAGTAMAVPVF